jgi:hypothetical protein
MSSKSIIFSLTPAEFEQRKQELIDQQQLEMPPGNAGEVHAAGITIAYNYDGVSTLTIDIVHKPMLVPESMIVSRLREWFGSPIS